MHLLTFIGFLCICSTYILAVDAIGNADVAIAAGKVEAQSADALLSVDVDTPHENEGGRVARQFGFGGFGRRGFGRRGFGGRGFRVFRRRRRFRG
ncbi:uncharacterized protein LOC128858466 [Anastrepha ludens]|uniref:uncharacterized protein LOC128858466 n=1 Tax=Anastrepha ludens TaxID=28586 RepID=UPI0023B1C9E5|nr:uncharacterized protein LOC128858466 [Anastrepha ludens]